MPTPTDKAAESITWPAYVRTAVSILLLVHLVIVVTVPLWLVQPGPGATVLNLPNWRWVRTLSGHYIQAANASHGYAFFAPDPGTSSTLIKYTIEFDDDRETIEGTLPDLADHWPRLFYHRHFMLTEQLGARMQPQAPQRPGETWQVSEDSRRLATSYAEHLLHKHDASRVSLDVVRHEVPGLVDVRDGMKLTEERLYSTFPISPFVVVQQGTEEIAPPEEVPVPVEEVPAPVEQIDIPRPEEVLPSAPLPEPLP